MTARGWWFLFAIFIMLIAGVLRGVTALIFTSFALFLWFSWEWLLFGIRCRTLRSLLRIERDVGDERGNVANLWVGHSYSVRVKLRLVGMGKLPVVLVADPVPFGVRHEDGDTSAESELTRVKPITLDWSFRCSMAGLARFEGLRVELADVQGFFCFQTFIRAPLVLRILPAVIVHRGGGAIGKRHNMLPPPGIHRLKSAGSGSELLDLRDYVPGDPPRTIAWKVSARRDKLITKEFESEVPVRCTLFLDTSSSVRLPSPLSEEDRRHSATAGGYRPLDRLIDLAAGVIRANSSVRDLSGLCLFDDQSTRFVKAERTSIHLNRLMQLLGEAAALGPVSYKADTFNLIQIAYSLAQEIYPDLLRNEVNHIPAWITWLVGFPGYSRHRHGAIETLHRRKRLWLLWGTVTIPMTLITATFLAQLFGWVPEWARTAMGGLCCWGIPISGTIASLMFLFSLLASGHHRKLARWRKKLSAMWAVLYGPTPGGLQVLLEDDDQFALYLERFLAEHQVPIALPLYDEKGRYLFAQPDKVQVLSKALIYASAHGRDNELFVLLADLLELDDHLEPLLGAVRVAVARHHQVLVICPWPPGVPMPGEEDRPRKTKGDNYRAIITGLLTQRLHRAYANLRRTFSRLGVQVVCAASDESIPLVLEHLERIRRGGRRR